MRNWLFVIFFIIFSGAVYTAYGFFSYTPKELSTPKFDIGRPDPEDLKRSVQDSQPDLNMSKQLKSEKQRMVARVQKTLKQYREFIDKVPQQASRTLQVLYKLMRNTQLPVFYPVFSKDGQGSGLRFAKFNFSKLNVGQVRQSNSNNLNCNEASGRSYNLLIGSAKQNRLRCPKTTKSQGNVRIYIAGPSNDRIEDARGHTIINAGSGNDNIATGSGSTIIYVEPGWGKDELNISCDNAKLDPARFPDTIPAPWKYKYANFIVFAPGISPSDIAYKNGVVRHRDTGDRLSFDKNCFNYVFASKLDR